MKKVLLFFAIMMMAITASARDVVFTGNDTWSKNYSTQTITCTKDGVTLSLSADTDTPDPHGDEIAFRGSTATITVDAGTATVTGISVAGEPEFNNFDLTGSGPWTCSVYMHGLKPENASSGLNQVTGFTVHIGAAHNHNYADAWSKDETNHWHACTGEGECDAPKADEAAHSYGEVATETAYYTCSVCQYENITRKAEYEAAVEAAKYATLTYNVADQGGLGVKVKKGEVTLNVTAEEDWTVATLTVNSEDKLADLNDGKLIFDMQDDAIVAVTYKWADEENLYTESDITTGIITTKADVKAYVKDGQICVESNGAAITLYTINGAKIAQKTPAMKTAIFTVPEGIYIVKVGNEGIKLSVK